MKVSVASMIARRLSVALVGVLIVGCAASPVDEHEPSGHIGSSAEGENQTANGTDDIPAPVSGPPKLPAPAPPEETERYTVVVDRVPVNELLFALARDADLEIDIVGDIEGRVTMNATDATLPRLLERIAQQSSIRYELRDDYLRIAADDPYVVSYPVDYVNVSRTASSSVDTATQITSTGFGGEGGGAGSNNSSTSLTNESDNQFWSTLERNLAGVLDLETEAGEASNRRIMLNREAGYVTVRATERAHREVQSYLDQIVASARRQVLIEATVVEVTLDERHQAGVDWAQLADSADGLDVVQNVTGSALGGAFNDPVPPGSGSSGATVAYGDVGGSGDGIQGTIRLLNEFGDTQVMSSPKITALNNQLAILKVVDNRVYFTVDVEQTTDEGTTNTTFETEVNTVPVGLVMSVTPYIGEGDEVLLNVRPTVSRILGFVNDPNPELANAGVQNEIPEIQVREMESMLRVDSSQTAVIGGLMQDSAERTRRSVPLLGSLPLIGGLFSYQDQSVDKTELIIFLRPTVIGEASVTGDFRRFRSYLPGQERARSGRSSRTGQ
ncbi:MAG: pilus (MSHA type) biogenesis protein MshL [Halofilum sp. (in: g-proteobacteria)]